MYSRSSSTFPLNSDLTDCLLRALPDFQSLQAFISSSKSVYSAFRCRPNSILGAVAHSQFGPTLPQAMHLVEHLDGAHSPGLAHGFHRFPLDLSITPAQVRLLRDHASIVQALEDIYSWREKDPRSRSSCLSAAESLRFQQSVYKFWLLATFYGPGALVNRRFEYTNEDYLELKDSIATNQMAFLSSLGKIELLGVYEVHRFLMDLAKWALFKYATRPTRLGDRDDIYLVWSGPAVTLDAFRGKWPFFRPADSQWYGTWRATTHIFLTSKITSITRGGVLSTVQQRFILDDHFLKTVHCSQCSGLPSLSRWDSLWSHCNWEYMILAIAPSLLGSFLSFERRRPLELLVSFTEITKSIPYPQFIEEVFDVRSERYKDWKKDDWLCTHCMTKLLSHSVQTWFDDKITEANSVADSLVSVSFVYW